MALGGVGAAVSRYADVVRVPGAALPVVGTVLATLPIGMLGLSVLLMVQQSSAGFSGAGLVVGALGLGTGLGMAFQGRLIDLFGQPRVLIPMATIQLVLLGLLVVAVGSDWPVWVICLVAFGAGVGEPQVGASLRSLWAILVGPEQRHVATALSSILFEAPIIAAPLLLAAVLVVANPSFGVLLAGGCFTAGAYLLSASKASRSWKPVLRARGRLLAPLARSSLPWSACPGGATGTCPPLQPRERRLHGSCVHAWRGSADRDPGGDSEPERDRSETDEISVAVGLKVRIDGHCSPHE